MPKNKVSDLITDQEMAFARLVLSGTMNDRLAAESVGLPPDSAAYTKSKPRVRAYMLEYRAAVQQQHAEQEAEERRRTTLDREQVLARLWEIANLNPEMTRGSITGQVKALAMIVAMQNFIPDRHAALPEKKPAPAPAQIYVAAWRREQEQAKSVDGQINPGPTQHEQIEPAPGSLPEAPANQVAGQSAFANHDSLSEDPPHVARFASVPDTRIPFSTKKIPWAHPR